MTPKSVNSSHWSRGIWTSITARAAHSGTRTLIDSGGAPRPVTSKPRSAPIRACVTCTVALAVPGSESSSPPGAGATSTGPSSARTVTVAAPSGGAVTSSSYTPGTRSSARTMMRAVPPPPRPTSISSASRNGCPFGS